MPPRSRLAVGLALAIALLGFAAFKAYSERLGPLVLLRRSGSARQPRPSREPTNQRLDQADLETMGIISLVIGVVLWILGSRGCQVGGLGSVLTRHRGDWARRLGRLALRRAAADRPRAARSLVAPLLAT